jgi:hypothetical protein
MMNKINLSRLLNNMAIVNPIGITKISFWKSGVVGKYGDNITRMPKKIPNNMAIHNSKTERSGDDEILPQNGFF